MNEEVTTEEKKWFATLLSYAKGSRELAAGLMVHRGGIKDGLLGKHVQYVLEYKEIV